MSKNNLGTLPIEKHGNTFHNLGKYPRMALLERSGNARAETMSVEAVSVKDTAAGFPIGGLWLRVYFFSEWHSQVGAS